MSAAPDDGSEARAQVVEVLAPVAVDAAYSYLAPPAMRLQPGDSVKAPLGAREAYGVVWSVDAAPRAGGNLKTITARLDRPPLQQKLRDFIDWLARYTLAPRGMALRLATRAAEEAGAETPRTLYRATGATPERLTPTRARALKAAEGGVAFAKKALAEAAACSTGVIDALVDEGALEAVAAPPEPVAGALDPDFAAPALEPAAAGGRRRADAGAGDARFSPLSARRRHRIRQDRSLFRGDRARAAGGRTGARHDAGNRADAQFLERFAARFGEKPAEWHSGVSPRKRARIWRGCATGAVSVVAGARSALFLPFSRSAPHRRRRGA